METWYLVLRMTSMIILPEPFYDQNECIEAAKSAIYFDAKDIDISQTRWLKHGSAICVKGPIREKK